MAAEFIQNFSIEDENPLSCYRAPAGVSLLFRALRPDELITLFEKNALLPPCNPCPGKPCCEITATAHVNSGSRAKIKSSWISTTRNPGIAALWSSTTKTKEGYVVRLEGRHSSGVFAVINHTGLNTYDPVKDESIGVTARNAAQKSEEILIKDIIPATNVIGLCQATQVKKSEYEEWKGGKISGKRTSKSSHLYVIWGPVLDISDIYLKEKIKSLDRGRSEINRLDDRIYGSHRSSRSPYRREHQRSSRSRSPLDDDDIELRLFQQRRDRDRERIPPSHSFKSKSKKPLRKSVRKSKKTLRKSVRKSKKTLRKSVRKSKKPLRKRSIYLY